MALSYSAKNSDRRRGLRVPQSRAVKIFHPTANRYIPAQTVDLSPTGLRLTLPATSTVLAGTILQVHVAASSAASQVASQRSMMPARVVWVDRSTTQSQLGLEYIAAASKAAVSAA